MKLPNVLAKTLLLVIGISANVALMSGQSDCYKCCGMFTVTGVAHRNCTGLGVNSCHVTSCQISRDSAPGCCPEGVSDNWVNDVCLGLGDPNDCTDASPNYNYHICPSQ